MPEVRLSYDIDGDDFSSAGEASVAMKKALRQMGIEPETIRRCSVCMYEGEMNAVIHAGGGRAEVLVSPERIKITIEDDGPGIADVEAAMREGYSTAPPRVRELGFGAGMGLPNMKRCSDELDIETAAGRGTKITMIVRL